MWLETPDGRVYVERISKEIVSDIAPEELDLFDELIDEYYDNPAPPDLSSAKGDDPLGFGVSAALMAAVTPAAAAMVSAVLAYVLKEVVKAVQEESADAIKKQIRSLFHLEKKGDGPEPLTQDQLEAVKKIARREAKKFGMEPDQARNMANALVGCLALA